MFSSMNTDFKSTFGECTTITTKSQKYFLAIHGVPSDLKSYDILSELQLKYSSINTVSLKYTSSNYRTIVVGFLNKVDWAETLELG